MGEFNSNFWRFEAIDHGLYFDNHNEDIVKVHYDPEIMIIPLRVTPELVSFMSPGSPLHTFKKVMNFQNKIIAGSMIAYKAKESDRIGVNKHNKVYIKINFDDAKKKLLKEAYLKLAKLFFDSGAKSVCVPSYETFERFNFLLS